MRHGPYSPLGIFMPGARHRSAGPDLKWRVMAPHLGLAFGLLGKLPFLRVQVIPSFFEFILPHRRSLQRPGTRIYMNMLDAHNLPASAGEQLRVEATRRVQPLRLYFLQYLLTIAPSVARNVH
jgi:hypothetical protein